MKKDLIFDITGPRIIELEQRCADMAMIANKYQYLHEQAKKKIKLLQRTIRKLSGKLP